MRQIGILLLCCISLLSSGAQTVPNLYREVDQEKMNHWVDSVFDAMSYDERIGQLFMVIANPKSDNRNMQRLMRYVNEIKIGGILFHKGDPVTQAEVTNRLQKASRILAKRTQADHGIIHIAIHVHIRSEIYMNSHFPALPSHLFSIFLDQGIVLDSA